MVLEGGVAGAQPLHKGGRLRRHRPNAKNGYRYETEILLRAAGGGQIQVERGKEGVRFERHGRRHRQEVGQVRGLADEASGRR